MGNQVPKVGIQINPFDGGICKYSDEYHRTCLGNEVAGPASRGPSIVSGPSDATNSALDLLAQTVFHLKEGNESTADVLSKQLKFQRELEDKMKDKTKEWHASTKKLGCIFLPESSGFLYFPFRTPVSHRNLNFHSAVTLFFGTNKAKTFAVK
jgi:hypothetical protein